MIEQINILDLPRELLNRILEGMDYLERWRIVPLTCRTLRQIHMEFPPPVRQLTIPKPTGAAVQAYRLVAPTVEALTVKQDSRYCIELYRTDWYIEQHGCPQQLPAILAVHAPRLRRLDVSWLDLPLPHMWPASLATLGRITKLTMTGWSHKEDDRLKLDHMSYLSSLQKLHLVSNSSSCGRGAGSDIWRFLTGLSRLRKLEIRNEEPVDVSPLLQCLTPPTQIRCLKIKDMWKHVCYHDIGSQSSTSRFTAGRTGRLFFQAMTQLTALRLDCTIPNASNDFPPLHQLRQLEKLSIRLPMLDTAPLFIGQERLRVLEIEGGACPVASKYLPPDMPAVFNLQVLKLAWTGLQEFPDVVAASLHQLTSLNLSHNSLTRLPHALSLITTLHSLDISSNTGLQLDRSDVSTLKALPRLSRLNLERWTTVPGTRYPSIEGHVDAVKLQWGRPSLSVISELCQSLPYVEMLC